MNYQSINIFRIWILEKDLNRKIISTRDVLFDENFIYDDILFDRSFNLEFEKILIRIQILQFEINNVNTFEKEKYVVEFRDDLSDEKMNETTKKNAIENVDLKMKNVANENAEIKKINRFFIRHDFTDFFTFSSEDEVQLTTVLLIKLNIAFLNLLDPDLCYECELQDSIQINKTFSAKIISLIHGAFAADRLFKRFHIFELPSTPSKIKELNQHFMKNEFLKTIDQHFEEHRTMKTFQKMHTKHAARHQILRFMWIFIYKTDNDGFVIKCKARLIVCENQQEAEKLSTKTIILISSAFRVLMIVMARYDLETVQMNAINAFVNCDLDEVVYMKISFHYKEDTESRRALKTSTVHKKKNPFMQKKDSSNSRRAVDEVRDLFSQNNTFVKWVSRQRHTCW